MALSAGADQNQTTSRILNKLHYAVTDVAADITTATTSDIVLMFDADDNYEPKYADASNVLELIGTTATATELNYLDITTLGTGAASKAVVLDANGDYIMPASGVFSFGGTVTDGLVAGAGSAGSEIELGSTAGTALNFRFRGSHTTGDMRGMYLRLDLDGTAASAHGGEALRTFTEIEDVDVGVGGTVNSIHATMEIDGNTGNVDGAGNVIRATLGGSGTKTLTGTLSGLNLHLDLPSAVTLAGTEAALRLTKTQDHEWPVFAAFDSIVGSGNAIQASDNAISGNASHAIHIQIDGVSHYIAAWDNATFS